MLPSKVFILSLIGCTLIVLVGPYNYTTKSSWISWFYLYFCFFAFWSGMVLGEKYKKKPRHTSYFGRTEFTNLGEKILLICSLFIFLSTLFSAIEGVTLSGGGLGLAAGAARDRLDLLALQGYQRSFIVKATSAIANGSLAMAMIVLGSKKIRSSILFWLSLLSPLTFAFSQLLIGGRNSTALVILSISIALIFRKKEKLPQSQSLKIFHFFFLLSSTLSIAIMIYLFAWRSKLSSLEDINVASVFIWHGEAVLRDFYSSLNAATSGRMGGLYQLSYYIGHAMPFFTTLFEASDYKKIFLGGFHFSVFWIILGRTDVFFEMVQSQPFYGLYPTMVQGFLLDFGLYFAPVFVFITGFIFGALANQAFRGKSVSGWILPIVIAIATISPVYYLTYGGVSFVILTLLSLASLLKVVELLSSRKIIVYQHYSPK